MPLLVDGLSVWDVSFRWAGLDPCRLWLRIPTPVKDNMRMLMEAILKAELVCETITLEKRHFEPDEKEFSVYHWLDDIYACWKLSTRLLTVMTRAACVGYTRI